MGTREMARAWMTFQVAGADVDPVLDLCWVLNRASIGPTMWDEGGADSLVPVRRKQYQ